MAAVDGTPGAIGKSVQIRGEVKGSEDLMIDGVVEGTITLSDSRLTIGPNAHVEANVSARDVVVLGSLNGNVTATGRVELRQGCQLQGDIRAGRLSIEDNAVFSGKVDMAIAAVSATAAEKPTAAPTAQSGALFTPPAKA